MINLARHKPTKQEIDETTAITKAELVAAGITPMPLHEKDRGEVPSSVQGKYKGFEFRRAWYYWTVEGLVPLGVALEMHKNPNAVKDVRVNGHCCRPEPGAPGGNAVEYDLETEKIVVDDEEWKRGLDILKDDVFQMMWQGGHVPRSQAGPKRARYIVSYHIDTQEGLNCFMDYIRKHSVTGRLPSES